MVDEARRKGAKVHFASLMDICHLKNAELETKHQKYKGRVVLRGDIVKDDSGYYGVLTEQRSSALQMTTAKSWMSSPDCQGVQDKHLTQNLLVPRLKWKMLPNYQKFPKSECPDIGIRLPGHKWPKSGPIWKTQSFLLSEIFMVILWQDCYGKGNLRKSY